MPPAATVRRATYLLFFLSGASGLIFETLWAYQATLALGSSYWAVTAVLAAFMGGLALGNLLSLRRGVWTLATYAVLEAVVLVTGLAALFLLPSLGKTLTPMFAATAEHPVMLNLLRFVCSFVVLALPSTAMGMTLPALAQALGGEHGSFRAVFGRLYGLNTLGAIAGVLGTELLLLPTVGVFGSGLFACVLNGAAAAGAWSLSHAARSDGRSSEAGWSGTIPSRLVLALLTVFLAGFSLLGLEVIWFRFLALFIPNSSLAFALMLATVLAGIAVGGIVGSTPWIPRASAFLLLFGAGVVLLAGYSGFSVYRPATGAALTSTGHILWVGFVLQFPVSFLSGAFFTLAGAEIRERIPSSQASAGLLVLFNTFGAALGAVAAGFLLVPRLGIEMSFVAVSLIYGAAAGSWFLAFGGNRWRLMAGAVIWVAALAVFPFGQFHRTYIPSAAAPFHFYPEMRIALREGLTETIIYLQALEFGQPHHTRMMTNSFSMSANIVPCDRYMKQFVYWPVALHPAPKRALLIGFGVGSTAQALTQTKELESIDVVDLSSDILEMSSLIFTDPRSHPLEDPRVKVHVEDGRFFLQTRTETWDLITGEPPPPELPGVAGLYSREYFQMLRARLSEGGIATYWLPIHDLSEAASLSILKAWSDVFEVCFLWRGANEDLMLTGFRGRPTPVTERRFRAQWEDPETRSELAGVGFDRPEILGTGFIGDADYIRSVSAAAEPTEDAFPKRIVAEGSGESVYSDWLNIQASADRFSRSSSISELWPEGVKARTLHYFRWEATLTTAGYFQGRSPFPDFPKIHQMLTLSSLRTPVMWELGSNRDDGRALEGAGPEIQSGPLGQFHLGARALADCDYRRASEHFLRTGGAPELGGADIAACLYALCMDRRKKEAEELLAGLDEIKVNAIPSEYWSWMKATFGLGTPP